MTEYYEEPRGSTMLIHVVTALTVGGVLTIAILIYNYAKIAISVVTIPPGAPTPPDPTIMLWAGAIVSIFMIAADVIGWYSIIRENNTINAIPLTEERIFIESRDYKPSSYATAESYHLIGKNGKVYRTVNEEVFAKAIVGTTIKAFVKYYPEKFHLKPLIVRIE
jgi:hypothetical protein